MPVRYLPVKKGFRYGKSGKLYLVKIHGKEGAREKAVKQGQAIKASEARVKASKRARGYVRRLE